MTIALLLTVDYKTGAASIRTLDEPSFIGPHIFEVNRWLIIEIVGFALLFKAILWAANHFGGSGNPIYLYCMGLGC